MPKADVLSPRPPDSPASSGDSGTLTPPGNLRQKTARGALIAVGGQGINFALRMGSMMIVARLITPEQFGLVGMVTALTGFLSLFREAGLSQATIQRATITRDQVSTLFWVNFAIGALLAAIVMAAAPLVAWFYGDARLIWITVVLASGFLFSGAAVQQRALLQRDMRFGVILVIDTVALLVSVGVTAAMALAGYGYWALVAMTVCSPALSLVGAWLASGWIPGLPKRGVGVRAMLHYGGTITLNSFVVYVAYNSEKVLLGRFAGAEMLGLYGRAYQLISLPTENLNSTISTVMFPALSRVQHDPQRVRGYFLRGYGLFLSLVTPITIACALFAHDIIHVLLGSQWDAAIPVFRLLAPTILAFALINPLGHLMQATGRAVRSLKISLLIAPVVVSGYVLGLPYGPVGVATGFSVAMMVLVAPVILWAKQGTPITFTDVVRVAFPPLLAAALGAIVAVAIQSLLLDLNPFLRLVVLTATLFGTHFLILLFALGQKEVCLEVVRAMGILPRKLS